MKTLTYTSAALLAATLLLAVAVGFDKRIWVHFTEKCHIISWRKIIPGCLTYCNEKAPLPYRLYNFRPGSRRGMHYWHSWGILYQHVPNYDPPFWSIRISFWWVIGLFGILPAIHLPRRLMQPIRRPPKHHRWATVLPQLRWSLRGLVLAVAILPPMLSLGVVFLFPLSLVFLLVLCAASAAITIGVGLLANELREAIRGSIVGAMTLYLTVVALGIADRL